MDNPDTTIDPSSYDMNQSILNKSRLDKYVMILSLPKGLINKKSNSRSNVKINFDSLQYTIYGTPVPDIIIPALGLSYSGQEIKISSHSRKPYNNIFIDFSVDNLYQNWWVIYHWLDLLNDATHSYYNYDQNIKSEAEKALSEYSANFTIYGLDEYDNKVIKFDYTGCFPVSLTSPKYSDATPDQLMSKIEFAFSFFEAHLV